uniref:Sulfate ABC transporter ATP-binding subunit n=1 Tax=Callipsygma wilsonis TaxID=2320807 RepID=A0A386AZY5_9CHLO|nr:Sulfate ABC transporter ATP-binding subunit [Callipsygma wilsonis]AYC65004.1 Sulfate ABC transporter ATP-binding subunit [Callipsygma wilsonis]
MSILIENISKKFNQSIGLSRINLEIKTGELVALLGPSGSGKSTLLRILAGFELPDSGQIWLFKTNATFLSIQERQIGFVSQDYALFPKMSIFENISFGLKIQNKSIFKVDELLRLIQLENLANFYPYQLSGGQKQRVAFARALSVEPKILLLDEPFGALDIKIRKNFRNWLIHLHKKFPVTTIFVTHNIHEAMEIADNVILLNKGCVEQFGCPQEIYEYPATTSVKKFIKIY